MNEALAVDYLSDVAGRFRQYQTLAERALEQISDDAFFAAPEAESNSIALIVKHLAGNMRSRWTEFLTTDGEKPDRHRDAEFELTQEDTRDALMARWAEGWRLLHDSVARLTPDDLARTITIRGEPHGVVSAINRQLAHAAYHAGQIVYVAKASSGGAWTSLSIPRG